MALDSHKDQLFLGSLAFLLVLPVVSAFSEPGKPFLEGEGNVCNGFICLNGGLCVNTTGQPLCACIVGFTGRQCEIAESPPVKEGTCPQIPADPTGQCPGTLCTTDVVCPGAQKCCPTDCSTQVCAEPELASSNGTTKRSVCDSFVCLNGGKCEDKSGAPECICISGYSGERCEVSNRLLMKEGKCPLIPMSSMGICQGTVCLNDAVCPGDQKCCQTACATKVCAEPMPVRPTCETMKCGPGATCLTIRASPDAKGEAKCVLDADRTCWASGYDQALLMPSSTETGKLSSVPCGGSQRLVDLSCPQGSFCSRSGLVSTAERICCSGRRAGQPLGLPRIGQVPFWHRKVDACGGCPANQRCENIYVQCILRPCPSIPVCVPADQAAKCPLPCPPGYTCKMQPLPCAIGTGSSFSGFSSLNILSRFPSLCDPTPRAVCAPTSGPVGSSTHRGCPSRFTIYFYMCNFMALSSSTCETDADCTGLQGNICCPTRCGTRYCMQAHSIDA